MSVTEVTRDFLSDFKTISFFTGLVIPLLLYWYVTRKNNYWKKRGVKYVPAKTLLDNFFSPPQKPFQEEDVERYNQIGKVYGCFESTFSGRDPALSVADPELLKDILVKDFHVFPNRRDPENTVGIVGLFVSSLQGEDWKRVRSIISPSFSTGKIKRVISIFKDCSKTLLQNFKMAVQRGEPIELKGIFGAFSMDVIASAAFSTKIDSHNDPQNKFVKTAREAFFQSPSWKIKFIKLLPRIVRKILSKFVPNTLDFFKTTALQIITERKRTGQTKNDFLQLLIEAATLTAKEEKWEDEDIARNYGDDAAAHPVFKGTSPKRLSVDEMVAQCVVFFLAGYHTSSLTLSFATYFLALHQDVQERALLEIEEVLKETNGELTSEAIQKMKYLDNIISETLRLYPIAYKLERIAEKDYPLGDTGIVISKKMPVNIPVYALHRDPQLFEDPLRFDPDRFSPEQRSKQVPYSYLPFGAGPRNCVGMRFALMEIKVCLVHLLSAFHLKESSKTQVPLEFRRTKNVLSPKSIMIEMEFREKCTLKE